MQLDLGDSFFVQERSSKPWKVYDWSALKFSMRDLVHADYMRGDVEDEDTLYRTARSVLGTGLYALAYIGSVLDKPAAAVRGTMAALGGETEHLNQWLLLLPFSESYLKGIYERLLGTKIPEHHITGREVLEAWGAQKNRPGFHPIKNPSDAALDALGLVIDILSFPPVAPAAGTVSARSFQVLAKETPKALLTRAIEGGRIVERVGLGNVIEEIARGERALLALKPAFPFRGEAVWEWSGPGAAKVAEYAQRVVSPVVRLTRHLFDWTARGAFRASEVAGMERAVDMGRQIISGIREVVIDSKGTLAALADRYAALAQQAGLRGSLVEQLDFDDMVRFIAEKTRAADQAISQKTTRVLSQLFGASGVTDDAVSFVKDVSQYVDDVFKQTIDHMHMKLREYGLETSVLHDAYVRYFPRYASIDYGKYVDEYVSRFRGTKFEIPYLQLKPGVIGKLKRRMDVLRNVPGGTVVLDRIASDPVASLKVGHLGDEYVSLVSRIGNDVFTYGDYVTDGRLVGRYLGVGADGKHYMMAMTESGLPGEIEIAEDALLKLRHTAPPRAGGLFAPAISRKSSFRLADQWLRQMGIDTARERALPATRQAGYTGLTSGEAIKMRYLYERYYVPFMDEGNPLNDIMYMVGLSDHEIADRLARVTHALSDPESPIYRVFSKKKWERITRQIKDKGGLLGFLLDYTEDRLPGRIFGNTVLDDYFQYMSYNGELLSALHGVVNTLARAARALPPEQAAIDRWVPLGVALEQVGIGIGKRKLNLGSGLPKVLSVMAEVNPKPLESGGQLYVSKDIVTGINRMLDTFRPGNDTSMFITQALENYTKTLTGWMTLPRLSFNVRNYLSQTLMGIFGDTPYTVRQYFKRHLETGRHLIKGDVKSIAYIDEIRELDFLRKNTMITEMVSPGTTSREAVSITAFPEVVETAKAVGSRPSAWTTGLLKPAGRGENVVLDTGLRVMEFTEALTRIPVYQAARDAGYTPTQAAELVKKLIYDYSRLSPFERRYASNAFLFYNWLRQNLPAMVMNVGFRWHTGHAATVRAIWRAQQAVSEDPMPAWLSSTLPVPLPIKDKEGRTVVIRQFGLPTQDLAILSADTAELQSRFFAQLHPIGKLVYKIATGREPLTGLPIKVTESSLEKMAGKRLPTGVRLPYRYIEELFPVAPMFNVVARALNPSIPPVARVIDFATGIKVDAYDLKWLALLEARDRLSEMVEALPYVFRYETVYIPEKYATEASPEAQELVGLYRRIEKRAREIQKRRREGIMMPTLGGL